MLQTIRNNRDPDKRFRKELQKANDKHDSLLQAGKISVAPEFGKLAIVASQGTTCDSDFSQNRQVAIFSEEAETLKYGEIASGYSGAEVFHAATATDVKLVLLDSEIAGVILVGHGSISALRLKNDRHFDWHDASRTSNHLKQGHFVQRMCGSYALYNSAPLGTFIVTDQTNITAAIGEAIDDVDPDEESFVRIYSNAKNSVDDIIALRDHYIYQ